jgi:hypothetical protein
MQMKMVGKSKDFPTVNSNLSPPNAAYISDDYESDEDLDRLPNGNLPTYTNLDAKLAL